MSPEPVPTPADNSSEATLAGPVPLVPLGRPSAAAAARLVEHGLRHPFRVARGGLHLTGELAAVAKGTSSRVPEKGDRRFADPAFAQSPAYSRLAKGYLAATAVADDTVGRLGLDPKSEGRARFVVGQVADALAPTNRLVGNPAALRKAKATRGKSLLAGARNLAGDVLRNGGMPTTVDSRPFVVGETVGVSPGSVVFRDEVAELIQYQSATPQVWSRPVVIVPPEISRHYLLDLSPGRSLVEHLVSQGHQVFVLSWRNPTAAQRDWNLDTYVATAEAAVAAACHITGSPDVHLVGACAGGVTSVAMAGHLAAVGDRSIYDLTLFVTVLDTSAETMASLFLSEWSASMAVRASQRKGMLPGRELSRIFAWMRPNDLVWNYWVNNYLMGNDPPAFDILAWNADMPNLSAGLHADLAALFLNNPLVEPGGLSVLGTPIDVAKIDQDAYVVAALTDHITPWEACYRSVGMLGGSSRFVLSSSGHIQAIINPPDNPKPATGRPTIPPATRTPFWPERSGTPARGGRNGRSGWPSGAVPSNRPPANSGPRTCPSSIRHPAPTCGPDPVRPVERDAADVGGIPLPTVVDVDGLRLRVSVVGDRSADAPPLLLCNGIGGAIELWEPLRAAFGTYPTIAFDAPGVAGSALPAWPPSMSRLADIVVRLLDHLGIPEVDALGVSWGGALAQELAHRHPDRIRRLVLCATGAGGLMIPAHPRVLAIMATPLRYWSPTYLNRVAHVLYGPDIVDDPELLTRQRHIRFTRGPTGRGYLYQVLALRRFASVLWLHRLRQPTLVLHGDADPIVRLANGKILAARIPDARLHTVPGGGHLFLVTRPEEMAELITGFLRGESRPRSPRTAQPDPADFPGCDR